MKQHQINSLPGVLKMKDTYLLYARKSTESEDRQVASIENQLEVLFQLAQSKGINILSTFTESKSAKKPGREQFNKMVDVVKQRDDIKGIICWKLNRLSRNPQDSGLIQQLLYDSTILEVVTPAKTYVEADSDFTMAIENSQSQRFIRDLREDTKRGIENKLTNGHAPIRAPAGYRNDMEKRQGEKTISPHPIYFKLVRKLFELAMTGQFSTQSLYIKARQMGVRSSLDRPISITQMYRLLKNPFYTGRFTYAGITYVGDHTPMVSDDEFQAVQNSLEEKSNPRKTKHQFALNGFIKCGVHDYYFSGEHHTKKSGLSFDYYKCTRKGKDCNQPMVSAKELERQVGEYLKKLTIKKAYIDWCTKWLRESELQDRAVRNKQHTALKTEYTSFIKRIDNLTDKWLSPGNEDKSLITDDEYKRLKQRYLIEKKDVYRKMKTMDKDIGEWTDTLISVFNFTHDLKYKWDNGNIETKKHIIAVVGSELYMKDKVLYIKPRSPFRVIEKFGENQKSEAGHARSKFDITILGGVCNDARTTLASNSQEYQLLRNLLLLKNQTQFNYA